MRKYEAMGYEAGKAAGSWAIDGNTSEETCARILKGYEEGDPEIMNMEPIPFVGLYTQSIADVFKRQPTERMMNDYESGFQMGYWDEVTRACRVQTEPAL